MARNNPTPAPKELISRKIPPPVPPRPTKKQLEKSKKRQESYTSGKKSSPQSYAQAANSTVNILKIKEAFPALPNKKIIEIHNVATSKPGLRGKKIQSRALLESRPSFPVLIISLTSSWKKLILTSSRSTIY